MINPASFIFGKRISSVKYFCSLSVATLEKNGSVSFTFSMPKGTFTLF